MIYDGVQETRQIVGELLESVKALVKSPSPEERSKEA
jgi:hypothetical protein